MTVTDTGNAQDLETGRAAGQQATGERADLLSTLRERRDFLRRTLRGMSDKQARERPTTSQLCLGGLVKHLAAAESQWMDFVARGADAMQGSATSESEWAGQFELLPGETVAGVLERYAEVADCTDALVVGLPDLDLAHPLPAAPWFEPGACWSARRVLLHLMTETAQHAGHADIIRESIDGARTMG